jgi:hypothetical protein
MPSCCADKSCTVDASRTRRAAPLAMKIGSTRRRPRERSSS